MAAIPTPPPQAQVESPHLRSLIAGGLAGTIVDLSLHPLDTLKTRLQSSAGLAASGGFRGIYKGVGSAVVGSAPGAALFFVTYDATKDVLRRGREADAALAGGRPWLGQWAEPVEHMAAASLGEVAACAVRVPTEVVKQRAQAGVHASSWAALRATLGGPGAWRELYRGWGVTVLREVPFTMIQFPLWEGLKAWRRRRTGATTVAAVESAAFGSLAGAVAAGVTTPLDVLKTRLMLAEEKHRAGLVLLDIMRDSGPRALFAGIGPRVLWISVGGAVFLGSYQWAYNALQ